MPALPGAPFFNCAQFATANTNRDGTGTLEELAFAEDRDLSISRIRVVAAGTTTAGVIRVFHYTGAVYRLIKEILVSATTPSTSVEVWVGEWQLDTYNEIPYVLPKDDKLFVSTNNAETFNAFVFGSWR